MAAIGQLYLIEILHQTTTLSLKDFHDKSCILLKFYIKPQLFCVKFKHNLCCILLKFYIKPQLITSIVAALAGCILLKFYIKPQPLARVRELLEVVSY